MYLVTEQLHIIAIRAIRRQVSYNIEIKLNRAGVRVSQKRMPGARKQYKTGRVCVHTHTPQMLCCRITTLTFYIFNKF